MKKFKSGVKAAALSVAAVALAACGSQSTSSNTTTQIATEVKEATTITFWHAMQGPHEKALTKLTEDFMKANPNVKVELQNQSSYKDLQAKLNATFTSKQNLPTISQAYPSWLFDAAQSDLLVDLDPYIKNDKIGLKENAPLASLMKGAQIQDKQYGIPFNKSTEVLFYNKDLFEKYGVKVPTTMDEFKEVAKTIFEKSNGEVVGAGFDSLNNYYAIAMKNEGVDFNSSLDFSSEKSQKVVNFYAEGVKEGYFRIAGSDKFLSGPFANQKLAMYIGSSAGESHVAKPASEKGFTYGVAARPAKINLQQGTDVYMFSSASEAQRTAAYLYMKFLASADSQLYWAQQTGYMPIVESVLKSDAYKNSTTKVPAILDETTKELFSIPAVQNSDAAYTEVRTIMEQILATGTADFAALKAQLSQVWSK
ncbi:extracellular solute-binding protein [Carnobacteriaceae bacterium zg-ZUI252]|nr:extracellular solute-binding protein [Carnobacteriaceae bacterium zg-ZUI252]MBS4770828.1 extracellular solute-binding protein [Carnobacteriaceae bacterium zg-ZUI240]QTU83184.1 extracellular solute-binding protein [Carnobacteriaceae bacterium zg-C25]